MTAADPPPAAVLFDLDGTLVDSEKLWDVGLDELAAKLGGVLSRAARAAMVGNTTPTTMRLLHADLGLPDRGTEDSGRWLERRMKDLYRAGVPWRAGARELLAAVRAAGLPTALVTSTRRELVDVALVWVGAAHFDVVVCGDEVSRPKPDPEPYLRAAALLGVAPTRCVAVEDSPTGAAAAEAAGCAVLVVPSEVPVPRGPGRTVRESLVGLAVDDLARLRAS